MAVQLVKATPAAKVIAVDNRQEALDLAAKSGADHVVTSDDQAADAIKGLTDGHGADVLLDFVGAESTIELARAAAACSVTSRSPASPTARCRCRSSRSPTR